MSAPTYVALLHHPVYDRHHRRVASAVTHLDIHDIARAARTYGCSAYYLCHPVAAQRELAHHVLTHWREARDLSASRRWEALARVRVVESLALACVDIEAGCGFAPFVVATSAASQPGAMSVSELRRRTEAESQPLLLVFGTGWGLCEEVFASVDATLEPIDAGADYNHLPVRAAVAIVLDRLRRR